jgi:hypothetical protein
MTIDEAIENFRYDAEQNKVDGDFSFANNNEQVAQWLEELKAMRNLDKTNFSDGYNRAIDDFLKEADATFPMQSDGTAVLRRLEKISDRLKGGVSSE